MLLPLTNVTFTMEHHTISFNISTWFNNHTSSFRHKRYSTDTELSKYIWKPSKGKIQYEIKLNIATYASPYKCGSRRCDLCLTEKLKITREDPELLLNKRLELVSKCRHKNKFILANISSHSLTTCIAIGSDICIELTYHVTLFWS